MVVLAVLVVLVVLIVIVIVIVIVVVVVARRRQLTERLFREIRFGYYKPIEFNLVVSVYI